MLNAVQYLMRLAPPHRISMIDVRLGYCQVSDAPGWGVLEWNTKYHCGNGLNGGGPVITLDVVAHVVARTVAKTGWTEMEDAMTNAHPPARGKNGRAHVSAKGQICC